MRHIFLGDRMKKNFLRMAGVVLVAFFAGCACGPDGGVDHLKRSLKQATKSKDPQVKLTLLRSVHDAVQDLSVVEPDAAAVEAFLGEYSDQLARVPDQICRLSVQLKDFDAFMWAIDRSAAVDLSYPQLIEFWGMGSQWRDFVAAAYPAKALPIFMDKAINTYSVRFFDKHVGAFRDSGFKVCNPLESIEFNVRFCRFLGDEYEDAIRKKDAERVRFLIDHTPRLSDLTIVDSATMESMRSLGDFVIMELKDESLACRFVELGYELNRLDFSELGFGADFDAVLQADPEHAIKQVLKINEWYGPLSDGEADFVLSLSEQALSLVHKTYISETVKRAMQKGDAASALRLIKFREKNSPLTRPGYDQLLEGAITYANTDIFDYVMEHCEGMSIYNIDLVKLAGNFELFARYVPAILQKVYRGMDTDPRKDGVTIGRLREVLMSPNHKSAAYLISKASWQRSWPKITGGRTLLMDMCHAGNLMAARYLLEKKGADIHAHTGYIERSVSEFGRSESREGKLSPIFFAAASGNSELIRYLTSKGARHWDRSAYGATPLMFAVSENHLDAVKTLIALGANVNATMSANPGSSALMEAGSYEDVRSAYRRAMKTGNEEMIAVLQKAGARL